MLYRGEYIKKDNAEDDKNIITVAWSFPEAASVKHFLSSNKKRAMIYFLWCWWSSRLFPLCCWDVQQNRQKVTSSFSLSSSFPESCESVNSAEPICILWCSELPAVCSTLSIYTQMLRNLNTLTTQYVFISNCKNTVLQSSCFHWIRNAIKVTYKNIYSSN